VEIAFPEVSFPASLELDTNSVKTSIQALPANMKDYPPYDDLAWGKFLSSDSAREIVLSQRMLRRLKIIVKDKDDRKLKSSDISSGMLLLPPDSIIGRRIDLVTAVLSAKKAKQMAGQMMMGAMMGRTDFNKTREINPFENKKHEFIITGVLKKTSPMGGGRMSSNAIIPIKQAAIIPRTSINSVWDVLGEKKGADSAANVYNSIYVRAESVTDMEKIRSKLEAENYNIFSLADQMDDIRNAFIFIDAILGTIGIVALIVAALGIINTMVMSILERKKEIGVMKAIGGGEGDIRLIFFVEATVIGVVGGALGLAAGWVFTSIANLIINGYLKPPTESPIDMFYFPVWLIAGAMIFSVCVSLAAGLYPAYRAARVDPVEALRHE
jgi:putative ABC transport system permease protein